MSTSTPQTLTYEVTGRIARITLNRPHRGNAITFSMPGELAAAVERANLDPAVHAIALSGAGKGFCGGYDLVASAGGAVHEQAAEGTYAPGSPTDPGVVMGNHDPSQSWDPMLDYQFMSRNVRGFMSLFHSDKPVVCKVHGFCVAGGTDLALCSDLLIAEDRCKIGYPPARVWGVPTTALWVHRIGVTRARRLLLTGDCISGEEAVQWGLASESAPAAQLDERCEALLARIARVPINQLIMQKLVINSTMQAMGISVTQILGTVLDGVSRHTREGYAFAQSVLEKGARAAVRERDEPFGDFGASTFRG